MMNLLKNFIGLSHVTRLDNVNLEHLNNLNFVIFQKDNNGKYVDCNNRMAEINGLNNRDELLGITDYDFPFFTEQEALLFRKNDMKVIKEDKPTFFIESATLPGEKKAFCFTEKYPLRLYSKKIIGSIGFSLIIEKGEVSFPMMQGSNSDELETNSLSDRQADCLLYLVKGMTMKQIAKTLHLSPKTVEHYLETVKEKLNCHNRAELIVKALKMMSIINRL